MGSPTSRGHSSQTTAFYSLVNSHLVGAPTGRDSNEVKTWVNDTIGAAPAIVALSILGRLNMEMA